MKLSFQLTELSEEFRHLIRSQCNGSYQMYLRHRWTETSFHSKSAEYDYRAVVEVLYSSAKLRHLYLCISILYNLIHVLHFISEAVIVWFTPFTLLFRMQSFIPFLFSKKQRFPIVCDKLTDVLCVPSCAEKTLLLLKLNNSFKKKKKPSWIRWKMPRHTTENRLFSWHQLTF